MRDPSLAFDQKIESKIGDLDELFAFSTPKIVVIKDRFLGLLALLFKVLIIVYIVITVIVNKGYLIVEVPQGTSSLSLHTPPISSTDVLPYCTNSPAGGPFPALQRRVLPCAFMEREQVNVPSLGGQLFATTRLTRTVKNYTCPMGDFNCYNQPGYPSSRRVFVGFIAGVEEGTLRVVHNVEGRGQVNLQRSLYDMVGVLKDCDGNVRKEMPKRGDLTEQQDLPNRIFKVKDLIAWAAPGLSSKCTRVSLEDQGLASDTSLRYDGMMLKIVIEYDNVNYGSFGGSTANIDYVMRVYAMTRADPKYETLETGVLSGTAKHDNRHGLHFHVVQTGSIGQFSFAQLVISLTAGLGLLAVANTITELLAKFVMPLRREYRKLMLEVSHDFSQLRDTLEKAEAEAEAGEDKAVDNEAGDAAAAVHPVLEVQAPSSEEHPLAPQGKEGESTTSDDKEAV